MSDYATNARRFPDSSEIAADMALQASRPISVQALLGEGTNGRVFRAEDLQLARQVALKVISLSAKSKDPLHTVDHAIAEARLSAGMEHPNIVHVYEVNDAADVCYIAMELVEGGNLKDLVEATGPMDCRRACQIGAEAAEALAYAHEHGVIHRDVKPANLMLSRGGRCKLADFGLAILYTPLPGGKSDVSVAGTPQFIAPELIGGEPASPRSDIYSLGATIWFLLTGKPPFVAESVQDILLKHLNDPLPKLTRVRSDVPESLMKCIARAMEKDPAKRYENAEQFAAVLRIHTIPVGSAGSSLAGLGLVAPEKPVPVRSSLLWGGLAATVGMIAAGAFVYWTAGGWRGSGDRPGIPGLIGSPMLRTGHANNTIPAVAAPSHPLPPVTLPAGTIIQATDTQTLTQLAGNDAAHAQLVTIEGTVASNQISKKGKSFHIGFDGADDTNDFICTYKSDVLPALQTKFGSSDGLGLQGKRIRVTGRVEMNKDRPTLKIETADQIEIAK